MASSATTAREKTTTIKAVVGIIDFEEGDIAIDGVSIRDDPLSCKSKTAYLPDNPDLYEYLTGIQYLTFMADVFGVSKRERERLIGTYSGGFDMTSSLGDLISSYSHGHEAEACADRRTDPQPPAHGVGRALCGA